MRMIVALAGLSLSLGVSLAQEPHPQAVPQHRHSYAPIQGRVYHYVPPYGVQPLRAPHYVEWQGAPGVDCRDCTHGRCPAVQRANQSGVNVIILGTDGQGACQECRVHAAPAELPACACGHAADPSVNCRCPAHAGCREQWACTSGERCCCRQATAHRQQVRATAACRCGASGRCDENCRCAHGRGCACGQQTIAPPTCGNVPRFQVLLDAPDQTAAVRPAWPVGRVCDVVTNSEEFHGTLCHADEQWFVLENNEGRHWIRAAKVERVTEVSDTAAVAWKASEGSVPGCEQDCPPSAVCELGCPAAIAPHRRSPQFDVVAAPKAEVVLPHPSVVQHPSAAPAERSAATPPYERYPAVVPPAALPAPPQPPASPAPAQPSTSLDLAVPPTATSLRSDSRGGECRPAATRNVQSAAQGIHNLFKLLGLEVSLEVDTQPREAAEQVLVELKLVQSSETGERVVACPKLLTKLDRKAYVECPQFGQIGVCVHNTDAGNMEVAVFQGSESSQPRAKGQLADGDGLQLRWDGEIAGGRLHLTVHRMHPKPVLPASYAR